MSRRLLAAAAATALVAAGCGSGSTQTAPSGTVSFALPPNATPNWIFPLGIPGYLASYNSSIYALLYTPLYSFNGTSGTVALDPKAGAAQPPQYSADGKTVTITLND